MEQQRTYYEYYEEYWESTTRGWSPQKMSIDPRLRALICQLVRPRSRVLDYGCGDGSKCNRLIQEIGAEYIGVDVSLNALRLCRQRTNMTVLCGEEGTLPFLSGTFDVVLCFEVLEHLFRPDLVLYEIKRLLHPGGVLILSVPNVVYLGNRLFMLAGFFNPGGSPETSFRAPWRDPHIRFFSKRTLCKLLIQELHFESLELTGTDFSVADLPPWYKMNVTRQVIAKASTPFRLLGPTWPSLFASHLFAVARKSEA